MSHNLALIALSAQVVSLATPTKAEPHNEGHVHSCRSAILYLHNNTLAHGTVTNNEDDVGLHEYSC